MFTKNIPSIKNILFKVTIALFGFAIGAGIAFLPGLILNFALNSPFPLFLAVICLGSFLAGLFISMFDTYLEKKQATIKTKKSRNSIYDGLLRLNELENHLDFMIADILYNLKLIEHFKSNNNLSTFEYREPVEYKYHIPYELESGLRLDQLRKKLNVQKNNFKKKLQIRNQLLIQFHDKKEAEQENSTKSHILDKKISSLFGDENSELIEEEQDSEPEQEMDATELKALFDSDKKRFMLFFGSEKINHIKLELNKQNEFNPN